MRGLGAILGVALLVGCDPAVDGDYEGEARFRLDGLVCALGNMRSSSVAIGVAWMTLAPDATRLSTVTGEAHLVDATKLPANFHVPLYDAPPPLATSRIQTVDGQYDVAIGIPVMFDDRDGDGTLSHDVETIYGTGRGEVVLYSQKVGSADVTPVLETEALPAGWSVGKPLCDDALNLTGLEVASSDTRFDVWLKPGFAEDNPLDNKEPAACLLPY